MGGRLIEPELEQILAFCAEAPLERVFLEDIARRGLGRFRARRVAGRLRALCHVGANVVPAGEGCAEFAALPLRRTARMVIGEEVAVSELWAAAQASLPQPRVDRPGQPVYVLETPPAPGETGLRPARLDDLDLLLPACAAAHAEELGVDPLRRDRRAFLRRTREQIELGRSWLWAEGGTVLFKAEASAWTPSAVQLQQVWVDPPARGRGNGGRGLRDLLVLLLGSGAPAVTLFVRSENRAAIALYDAAGMRRSGSYRSVIL